VGRKLKVLRMMKLFLTLTLIFFLLVGCGPRRQTDDLVPYDLISRSDLNTGGVKSSSFRVVVSPAVTDEQLLDIFLELDNLNSDMVTIWFFREKGLTLNAQTKPFAVVKREQKDGIVTMER